MVGCLRDHHGNQELRSGVVVDRRQVGLLLLAAQLCFVESLPVVPPEQVAEITEGEPACPLALTVGRLGREGREVFWVKD